MLSNKLLQPLVTRSVQLALRHPAASIYNRAQIGNRDWVGFGVNGQAVYFDRFDFPYPGIRFQETTKEILALREKEKGDWKKLSIEDKKALYRASFCQTFAEFGAPSGEWKGIMGLTIAFCSLTIWIFMGLKKFVYGPYPDSFSEKSKSAQLRRMLDLQMGAATGISSQWDYEKDDWKK